MISGFETFYMFNAIRFHFSKKTNYDYTKSAGRGSFNTDTAYAKTKIQSVYSRIGHSLANEDMAREFFVANFAKNQKAWITDCNMSIYDKWRARQDSQTYLFGSNMMKVLTAFDIEGRQFGHLFSGTPLPRIVTLHIESKLELDDLVIIDAISPFKTAFDTKYNSDPIWSNLSWLIGKYAPFAQFDKKSCKACLLDKLNTVYGPPDKEHA